MLSAEEKKIKHRIYMREYYRDPVRRALNIVRVNLWRENNREKHRAYSSLWKKTNPEKRKAIGAKERIKYKSQRADNQRKRQSEKPAKFLAYTRARQVAKLKRTPAWADHAAILAVYEISESLSKSTGIKHHVDHVIPLRGQTVSGLHVHTNLQAIPAMENWRKNCRFELS